MYMPINPLGYSCIKKLQRDNLWHAYNEPINFYSVSNKFRTTYVGYRYSCPDEYILNLVHVDTAVLIVSHDNPGWVRLD